VSKRVELGCAGHLIVARWCLYRRHTQIGDSFRVSTVGDYRPPLDGERCGPRETIGAGKDSFYETMVFRTDPEPASKSEGCGCRKVIDWCEIDTKRYATAGEAHEGHERLVRKYMRAAGKVVATKRKKS
jgi:hypothetical protein